MDPGSIGGLVAGIIGCLCVINWCNTPSELDQKADTLAYLHKQPAPQTSTV